MYLALHKPTGKLVAVKVLQSNAEQDGAMRKMVLNEVRTVFQARSDHLVAFYDAFHHEGSLHLVLEYCDTGSLEGLYEALRRGGHAMSEQVLASLLFQIVQGLTYLHKEKRSVHRDLKPANVLLTSAGFVKLSDFGISRQLDATCAMAQTYCGTAAYMAPERLVDGGIYGFPSDIWSVGLIALEVRGNSTNMELNTDGTQQTWNSKKHGTQQTGNSTNRQLNKRGSVGEWAPSPVGLCTRRRGQAGGLARPVRLAVRVAFAVAGLVWGAIVDWCGMRRGCRAALLTPRRLQTLSPSAPSLLVAGHPRPLSVPALYLPLRLGQQRGQRPAAHRRPGRAAGAVTRPVATARRAGGQGAHGSSRLLHGGALVLHDAHDGPAL